MERRTSTILITIIAGPAFADPYPHMGSWANGHGLGWMLGATLWLVFLVVTVVLVIWAGVQLLGSTPGSKAVDAMQELDLRLARGDITIKEHEVRRKALMGQASRPAQAEDLTEPQNHRPSA